MQNMGKRRRDWTQDINICLTFTQKSQDDMRQRHLDTQGSFLALKMPTPWSSIDFAGHSAPRRT
jgi:hypothetical protein